MAGFLDILSDPRTLNAISGGLELGGRITSGIDRIQFGQQQGQAAQFAADQMRQQAGQQVAASQRSAYDVDQSAKYIASDALARAAASGGGASDPTVVNTIARIKAEGAYRSSLALYGGEDRARLLNLQADAKEKEGALAEQQSASIGASSFLQAGSSLLKTYANDSSILKRFGGNGPNISGGSY